MPPDTPIHPHSTTTPTVSHPSTSTPFAQTPSPHINGAKALAPALLPLAGAVLPQTPGTGNAGAGAGPSKTPAPTPAVTPGPASAPAAAASPTSTPTGRASFNAPAEAGPGPSTQLAQAQAQAAAQHRHVSADEAAAAAARAQRKRKWEAAKYSAYEQEIMERRATGIQLSLALDQDATLYPEPTPTRFTSYEDVVDRLLPYHIWQIHDAELRGSQGPAKEKKLEQLEMADAVHHIRRLTDINTRLRKALVRPASRSSDILSSISIGAELHKEEHTRLTQLKEVYAPKKSTWDRYQADVQRQKEERARAEERRRQTVEQERQRLAEAQREKERAAERERQAAAERVKADIEARTRTEVVRGRGRGRPRGSGRGGVAHPAQTHAQVGAAKTASANGTSSPATARPASGTPVSAALAQAAAIQPSPGRTTRNSTAAAMFSGPTAPGSPASAKKLEPYWRDVVSPFGQKRAVMTVLIDMKAMPQLADTGLISLIDPKGTEKAGPASFPGQWNKALGTVGNKEAAAVSVSRERATPEQVELLVRLAGERLATPEGQEDYRKLTMAWERQPKVKGT